MSIDIVSRAAPLLPALAAPPVALARRWLPALLDAGMFGGVAVALAEPNWVGIAALVTACGAIVVKLRELEIKGLRAENAMLSARVEWLAREPDRARAFHADPPAGDGPPQPTVPEAR